LLRTKKFLGLAEVDNLRNVVLNLEADIEWGKTTTSPKRVDGVFTQVE
jgi:hypothetical protein